MAKLNGTDLLLFFDGKAVAYSTSCELTLDRAPIDASNKDSAHWAESIIGQMSWSMSASALLDYSGTAGGEELSALLIAGTAITAKFGLKSTVESSGDTYWSGSAWITSFSPSADNEGVVSYSVTFTGNGALTQTAV